MLLDGTSGWTVVSSDPGKGLGIVSDLQSTLAGQSSAVL